MDVSIFGECQALLYNYEKTLIDLFGEDFAINESLVYSLQFSRLRTEEQILANKMVLSSELKDLKATSSSVTTVKWFTNLRVY